jgi:hypothetical protein
MNRYEIIQKPLLNLSDIKLLCGVGYKKAKEIQKLAEKSVYPNTFINGLIPTHLVIKVMNIDVDLIIKLARS